ncbi:MAG: TerC family protein [Candidatus Eremiobacterota bacterium]
MRWAFFGAFILVLLALDLGVFHRKAHKISVGEAVLWSIFWVGLGLAFNVGVYVKLGHDSGLEFLAGYLLEKSLSVDNLFVFLLIFNYFSVPAQFQHRVLFWGILGALVMRGVFILAGVALVARFHWLLYLFGAFLIYSGVKMAFEKDEEFNPEDNPVVKWLRRYLRITPEYHGTSMFVRVDGKLYATPLLVVLAVIETTDLLFAVDSIPAVFGVTQDPFIIFTSNVMAILGLRALYFALAGLMDIFCYLQIGLSAVLVFIGAKMIVEHWYDLPTPIALGTIGVILTLSVVASLVFPKKEEQPPAYTPEDVSEVPPIGADAEKVS